MSKASLRRPARAHAEDAGQQHKSKGHRVIDATAQSTHAKRVRISL